MQIRLRKYQDILGVSGLGIMAFAIWSVIKTVIHTYLAPNEAETVSQIIPDGFSDIMIVVLGAVIIFLAFADIGLRIMVGLSARDESRGKKKSAFYIIAAFFILGGSVFSAFQICMRIREAISLELAASLIFEVSSIFVMLELIISAIRVRSIKRKMAGEEKA